MTGPTGLYPRCAQNSTTSYRASGRLPCKILDSKAINFGRWLPQVDARLAVCFHVRIEIPVKSDSNEGGERVPREASRQCARRRWPAAHRAHAARYYKRALLDGGLDAVSKIGNVD